MNRFLMTAALTLLLMAPAAAENDPAFAAWLRHQNGILERLRKAIQSDLAAGNTARAASEQADLTLMERKIGEEIEFVRNAPDLTAGGRLDVRDFGAKGDGVTDDSAAIHRAISAALAGEVRHVFLPRGSYLISCRPESMVEFSQWSSTGFRVKDDHHPANTGAIVIRGKNLLLSGEQGTELLVGSPQDIAIHIIDSDNVRISDLAIRYAAPLTVSGRITALSGEDSIDVELDPDAGDPLAGYFRERGFKGLARFYNENRRSGDHRPEFSNDAIHQIAPEVTKISERRYRFRFKNFLPVQGRYRVGQHMTYYARSYTDHAVFNYHSKRTRLQRLKVTGSPAVAFFNFNSDMPFILDCEVLPEKGRFESTCADGLYFKTGFGGYASGNRLYGIGDDFINIHCRMAPVWKQEGNILYLPAKIWPEQTWKEISRLGIVRTSRKEANACLETGIVQWELIPPAPGHDGLIKVLCSGTLPQLAALTDSGTGNAPDVIFLPDREWHGLVIENNTFDHSVARVLTGGRNISITGNRFIDSLNSHSLVMPGLESVSRAGGESRFPRNHLFTRNEFHSKAKSVIQLGSRMNDVSNGIYNLEHIDISDNVFTLYGDSDLPVFNLSSADRLTLSGNRVEASGTMSAPVAAVRNCGEIELKGNRAAGSFPKFLENGGDVKELIEKDNRIFR